MGKLVFFLISMGITIQCSLAGEVSSSTIPFSPSTPSHNSGNPQEGYPVWTPCKDCRHVWYLTCKNPGKRGCIVDGKEIPYSEFVKRANRKAELVRVEKLSDGSVIVWFKW